MILWFYDLDGPAEPPGVELNDPFGSPSAHWRMVWLVLTGHSAFLNWVLWPWVSSTEMTALCIPTVRSLSWISCNICTSCPRKLPQQPLSWWGTQCAALVHCNNNIIRKIPSYHAAQGQMRSPSVLIQHGFCLFLIIFVGDAPITGVGLFAHSTFSAVKAFLLHLT